MSSSDTKIPLPPFFRFAGHGSEFLASPGNQQWMNPQQRNSPKQLIIKPPSLISPDPFQASTPNTIHSNPSPSRMTRNPSHCTVPNEPSCATHQRPPSVSRTPTTPSQNQACSFPFTEDLQGRAGFATPSPSTSRHPSTTPVDQRFQNDPNSLRKRQQLAYDKDSSQAVEPVPVSRKLSCHAASTFSPSAGSRRQRYKSVGITERPLSQQSHLSNIHASYQTSVTPPDRALGVNSQQQFGNFGEVQLNQPSSAYNKDLTLQRVNFASNGQGLHAPAPDCPWPTYPPNLARQQSAPPYAHFSGSVHEQSRIGLHQYQQYGTSGVNLPGDPTSGSLNPAHCAFPTGLPATYQHQALMARPSRDYSPAENYYHHSDFGPSGHVPQGDGSVPPGLFNSGQSLSAFPQQRNPYYNSYGGMYK